MLLNTYVRMRTMLVCRKGQGLVEYLVLVTLVAVGLIGIAIIFRNQIRSKFTALAKAIKGMK